MSGEPRRAQPRSGWQDPGRPGWTTKTVRLGPQALQALECQRALTPTLSENEVIGSIIREAHKSAEARLHGELLAKYHAGEMTYKELCAIAAVFSQVRIEVGRKPSMAEVARLTAERIAAKGEPLEEDQQDAE